MAIQLMLKGKQGVLPDTFKGGFMRKGRAQDAEPFPGISLHTEHERGRQTGKKSFDEGDEVPFPGIMLYAQDTPQRQQEEVDRLHSTPFPGIEHHGERNAPQRATKKEEKEQRV